MPVSKLFYSKIPYATGTVDMKLLGRKQPGKFQDSVGRPFVDAKITLLQSLFMGQEPELSPKDFAEVRRIHYLCLDIDKASIKYHNNA